MVFIDAKTVMINNKEVQSIITSNNGVLYNKISTITGYNLSIHSNKTTLDHSINESTNVVATLKNDGVGMVNEELMFCEQLNYMAYGNKDYYLSEQGNYICKINENNSSLGLSDANMNTTIVIAFHMVMYITSNQSSLDGQSIQLGRPEILIQNNTVKYYDANDELQVISNFVCSRVKCTRDGNDLYRYWTSNTDNNGQVIYEYTSNDSNDVNIVVKWNDLKANQVIDNI